MNFQPELAAKVIAGQKTVTRRLVSDNPRSPWYRERCALRPEHTYAVCPGRGKHAVGRVRVTRVRRERLGFPGLDEAIREGFPTMHGFRQAWKAINGAYDPDAIVWRVEFTAEYSAANSADPDAGPARPCNDASEASGHGSTSSRESGTSTPAGLNLAQVALL